VSISNPLYEVPSFWGSKCNSFFKKSQKNGLIFWFLWQLSD